MTETRFTKDHEWVRLDGVLATVGITNHAQEALGDVVFVELPQPGRVVAEGEAVAVVESVKAASDVYAPLAGTIVATNAAIVAEPALVNAAAEDGAWFFQIEASQPEGFAQLLDPAAYAAFAEVA